MDRSKFFAILPVYQGGRFDRPEYFRFVQENPLKDGEWVSAKSGSLDDDEWDHGTYFSSAALAVAHMVTKVSKETDLT